MVAVISYINCYLWTSTWMNLSAFVIKCFAAFSLPRCVPSSNSSSHSDIWCSLLFSNLINLMERSLLKSSSHPWKYPLEMWDEKQSIIDWNGAMRRAERESKVLFTSGIQKIELFRAMYRIHRVKVNSCVSHVISISICSRRIRNLKDNKRKTMKFCESLKKTNKFCTNSILCSWTYCTCASSIRGL